MYTLDTSFFMAVFIFILSRFKSLKIAFKYPISSFVEDTIPVLIVILLTFYINVYLLNQFTSFEYSLLSFFHKIIIYSILEEILFRYYLIQFLEKVNQNKIFLVTTSALVFAAFHLNKGPGIFLFALANGIIFGTRYVSTKNVLNPIVAHIFANLFSFTVFFAFQELRFTHSTGHKSAIAVQHGI